MELWAFVAAVYCSYAEHLARAGKIGEVADDFGRFLLWPDDDACFSESAGNLQGCGFDVLLVCELLDGFVEVFALE